MRAVGFDEDALESIAAAVEKAGYKLGEQISSHSIQLPPNSTTTRKTCTVFNKSGGAEKTAEELVDYYADLLPWRNTKDPYRILVSEVMLQQTRVAVVIKRYQRFLQRFPSVLDLARAKEASVLAEWSGLGYYRRARNLYATAKLIVSERKGELPRSSEDLQALPGIADTPRQPWQALHTGKRLRLWMAMSSAFLHDCWGA